MAKGLHFYNSSIAAFTLKPAERVDRGNISMHAAANLNTTAIGLGHDRGQGTGRFYHSLVHSPTFGPSTGGSIYYNWGVSDHRISRDYYPGYLGNLLGSRDLFGTPSSPWPGSTYQAEQHALLQYEIPVDRFRGASGFYYYPDKGPASALGEIRYDPGNRLGRAADGQRDVLTDSQGHDSAVWNNMSAGPETLMTYLNSEVYAYPSEFNSPLRPDASPTRVYAGVPYSVGVSEHDVWVDEDEWDLGAGVRNWLTKKTQTIYLEYDCDTYQYYIPPAGSVPCEELVTQHGDAGQNATTTGPGGAGPAVVSVYPPDLGTNGGLPWYQYVKGVLQDNTSMYPGIYGMPTGNEVSGYTFERIVRSAAPHFFYDHCFEMDTIGPEDWQTPPATINLFQQSSNPTAVSELLIEPSYNYFPGSYENIVLENETHESLLPNLYVHKYEMENTNTAQDHNQQFHSMVSLGGLMDWYTVAVGGSGIPVESNQGEYYQMFGQAIQNAAAGSHSGFYPDQVVLDTLAKKQKYLAFSTRDYHSFTSLVDFEDTLKLTFPMHIDIKFAQPQGTRTVVDLSVGAGVAVPGAFASAPSQDPPVWPQTGFHSLLADHGLSEVLMRHLAEDHILENESEANSSRFWPAALHGSAHAQIGDGSPNWAIHSFTRMEDYTRAHYLGTGPTATEYRRIDAYNRDYIRAGESFIAEDMVDKIDALSPTKTYDVLAFITTLDTYPATPSAWAGHVRTRYEWLHYGDLKQGITTGSFVPGPNLPTSQLGKLLMPYKGNPDLQTATDTSGEISAFRLALRDWMKSKVRDAKGLLNGTKCYNETLFYRLDKIDKTINSPTYNQVLQSIWLPAIPSTPQMRYVDTQVKYGKKYEYRCFAYQFVLGQRYDYVDNIQAAGAAAGAAAGDEVAPAGGHAALALTLGMGGDYGNPPGAGEARHLGETPVDTTHNDSYISEIYDSDWFDMNRPLYGHYWWGPFNRLDATANAGEFDYWHYQNSNQSAIHPFYTEVTTHMLPGDIESLYKVTIFPGSGYGLPGDAIGFSIQQRWPYHDGGAAMAPVDTYTCDTGIGQEWPGHGTAGWSLDLVEESITKNYTVHTNVPLGFDSGHEACWAPYSMAEIAEHIQRRLNENSNVKFEYEVRVDAAPELASEQDMVNANTWAPYWDWGDNHWRLFKYQIRPIGFKNFDPLTLMPFDGRSKILWNSGPNSAGHAAPSLLEESELSADFDIEYTPDPIIMEVPYFQSATYAVSDSPPLSPDVQIYPYRGIDDKILILLNGETGLRMETPILIRPDDVNTYGSNYYSQYGIPSHIAAGFASSNVYTNEFIWNAYTSAEPFAHPWYPEIMVGGNPQPLLFQSDDIPGSYEIFRLSTRPRSYQDFADAMYLVVDGKISQNKSSSSASHEDVIRPNQKYYYCFRTIDIHGNKSNPTPVYEVEMVNHDGRIYSIVKIIEFEEPVQKTFFKDMKRYLYIAPNEDQLSFNTSTTTNDANAQTGHSLQTAPSSLVLGPVGPGTDRIWSRIFKIRLTSKTTGKKIDFNITFKNDAVTNEGNQ